MKKIKHPGAALTLSPQGKHIS
uniref:Uncharacterized protein n=1 Tax=Rhizophora mucronata TaxID=61149 RepID=A0A2P2JBJ7_RHIMU